MRQRDAFLTLRVNFSFKTILFFCKHCTLKEERKNREKKATLARQLVEVEAEISGSDSFDDDDLLEDDGFFFLLSVFS